VRFAHRRPTRYQALGPEQLIPVYSPQVTLSHPPSSRLPYFPPGLQLVPVTSVAFTRWCRLLTIYIDSSSLLIYRPQKDDRLSWLACSGWFIYNSGQHPSAASRVWDRESSPARDWRSTTVPRNQVVAKRDALISSSFECSVTACGLLPCHQHTATPLFVWSR